jgi:hypothetical protein
MNNSVRQYLLQVLEIPDMKLCLTGKPGSGKIGAVKELFPHILQIDVGNFRPIDAIEMAEEFSKENPHSDILLDVWSPAFINVPTVGQKVKRLAETHTGRLVMVVTTTHSYMKLDQSILDRFVIVMLQ